MRAGSRVALLALALPLGCASGGEGITGDAGASSCGQCHTTEYAAWSASRLASSGSSPVFQALAASAATEWGATAKARCVTCHEPGFGGDHGVGCVACHSATGNLADRDGLLTVDLGVPVSGPFRDPLPTPAHGSRTYGLLESPTLCGTCHEVTGPGLLHETTLSEFDTSRSATLGASCATCHMPAISSGSIAAGEMNVRARSDHSFVGVDPPWGASAEEQAAASARTLQLLQGGLLLRATRDADGTSIDVTVVNIAAHSIPTGAAFLRGVWVDVAFNGANGATTTASHVIDLGAQPTERGANVALITQADSVTQPELAAGSRASVVVGAPSSSPAPLDVVVTLRACAIRPEILDALGLGDVAAEVPTHDVASVHLSL